MTAVEVEQYILSKEGVRKQAIPDWRYIRYTVFQSLFATLEEVHGEVYCSLFGIFPDLRAQYPACILPALRLNENYSSILLSGDLPDAVLRTMIDAAYEARCARIQKVEMGKKGAEDVPYGAGLLPVRRQPIFDDADCVSYTPHTVSPKYDADIARYVDLWRDIHGRTTEKQEEIAATAAGERGKKGKKKDDA